MTKIVQEIQGQREAEGAWTFRMDGNGNKTLVGRFIGSPKTISEAAISLVPGSSAVVPAEWPSPEGYVWTLSGVEATHESPVEAILTLTFSLDRAGGSSGIGSAGLADPVEVADFQNIEKPLTSAPFWSFNSEGAHKKAQAAKIAQLYIDAETVDKADELLEKECGKLNIDASGMEVIRKFIEKRLAGIEAYYYPAPTLSRTEESTTAPNDFGQEMAKIVASPKMENIPVPEGFKWLGAGDRLTYSGGVFTRERSYIGANAWDRDLYEEAT
ncbi:MAG: hypothetical protein J6L64_07785 [Opitutales bacterium]|nr:hypothetical protein [Opitutales bacterium]